MHSPSASPASTRAGTGRQIGRYRLIRPLSKGGMALVYEGRRESLAGVSPRVAVKLILPEHAASETFRELFINEARLGASMQHQNLVQIQDFDSEGDTYFLVMEYVEGFTLRKIIQLAERGGIPIPLRVIAEIGRQASDGLHYAHTARDEQGRALRLVHRDIKPSNLILNPHGVVKVLDFGISKGRLREERKGSVKGTWGYMAPEQAVGADVGPTADVFGLAVVLYELASLKPIFSDQPKEEMRRLLRDDHAARVAATLDGQEYGPLIGVLVRALQRDPAARYDSAEAFGRALSALLPDPITARDEVVRFHQQLMSIDGGSKAPSSRPTGSADSLVIPLPEQGRVEVGGLATFVGGLLLSLAVLGGVGGAVVHALGRPAEVVEAPAATPRPRSAPTPPPTAHAPLRVEPPGPAGEGAPGESRVGRAEPPAEVVTGPAGTVVIDARQPAEVYVDGRFVAATPATKALSEGTHTITLVAADGRRRIFDVRITAGSELHKTWDFDRMEWR